ncbi:MAG: hypothetical protein CVU56_06220 [Deltaproteobacteria bacterium HGW-Deltaproteobacteria-14]|jgi:hypothetical protein|nr:MAG: hypothetical protein CVU56_06220 [Deltaproteobacteria bacterium HGW-Deltaproteobacteria-14]
MVSTKRSPLSLAAGLALLALALTACIADPPTLGPAGGGAGPQVRFDVYHLPFAEIPLPNDFATRYDATSPTLRRLNASIVAGPTEWERATRRELDKLSGWGTLAPISVSFDAPIDPQVIIDRHWRDRYAFDDDAVLVIDVTSGSPDLCAAVPLDMGQGNYPQVLQNQNMFESDPRADLQTLVFEEVEEDTNGNGALDPGEDTDMDGVLDHPNTLDGTPDSPLLEFYERETNTLILKPIMPMREKTTYAVVLTKRLTSPDGDPVRSPFTGINHTGQTDALAPLPGCLKRYGLGVGDVAFTWTFTTQSITDDFITVRDGLYGIGPLASIATDFPASVTGLRDVRDDGPGVTNTKIVPGDEFLGLATELSTLTGSSGAELEIITAQFGFIDFVVSGEFTSPQFFPRDDASGKRLPLYEQVWDLAAPPRAEALPFWLFVPKGRSGPAPVALFIHGHGGSKFDALPFAGLLAGYGIATLGFEAPGHGVSLPAEQLALIRLVFEGHGLGGLADGLLTGRALDWNGDGAGDSGADYWTAYVFHTRDNVRQTMVDVMQIVRTLRAFDGTARWAFDPAETGSPGLAGDFDGDGTVDVGGEAPMTVIGGSLGGINGAVAAGVEPHLDAAVAIVPGGVLGEIGTRSTLGGIRNAMVLRALAPVFFSQGDTLKVRVNEAETESQALSVHALPALAPGDTAVLWNLKTGEHRCGVVQPSGSFRVSVAVDKGDPLELQLYAGALPPLAPAGCDPGDAEPIDVITTFDANVQFEGVTYAQGTPLVALSDGFGQRRASPDLRRLLGLSQIALDPGDPANWAPYWDGTRKLTYGTGETTRTQVIVMPSAGDPGVPVAMGIALARAAGFIAYDSDDPRYGKPQNQVLIDTWAIEGIPRTNRYQDSTGRPVLMDVEHLADVVPVDDGLDVPRLDPPLRLMRQDDATGTWSGLILPMLDPQGKHGFNAPDPSQAFDLGAFLLNQIGRYLATGGAEFSWDACQADWTCDWIPTPP